MKYEDITYEVILERMLDQIDNRYDKRESSVLFNALAPAAVELAIMYMELDGILQETFADTATRDNLVKRASERGIRPYPATNAVVKGEFTPVELEIPIGARFSLGELNYIVIRKVTVGEYQLQCEQSGAVGNDVSGELIPIDYIDGLESATLTDLIIPGQDEEDTEILRTRYFESFDSQAYGGNVADYKMKVGALNGVGGVKVYRTPHDLGGQVRLVIIDSTYSVPSNELINVVQNKVDPTQNQGQGDGIAPIGHLVSVEGVTSLLVDISTTITYQDGWSWLDIESYVIDVIDDYLNELSSTWADEENIVVRISQIETRLLNVPGVIDIGSTTINGLEQNLILDVDAIPIRGELNG